MKCSCGHKVEEHKFNLQLETYDECRKCECEGYDLESNEVDELEF